MATPSKLSKNDIQNLKEGLNKVFYQLENDKFLFNDFYNDPIQFLKGYDIKILDYLNEFRSLKDRLKIAIREVINQFGRIINSCLICKTTVLLILFGTLGKSGVIWTGILDVVDYIIDSLKDYFDRTSAEIERAFDSIDNRLDRIRPSHLALQICISMGYCSNSNRALN